LCACARDAVFCAPIIVDVWLGGWGPGARAGLGCGNQNGILGQGWAVAGLVVLVGARAWRGFLGAGTGKRKEPPKARVGAIGFPRYNDTLYGGDNIRHNITNETCRCHCGRARRLGKSSNIDAYSNFKSSQGPMS
jgi:hypothetical protein